jgi:hypothetical protein
VSVTDYPNEPPGLIVFTTPDGTRWLAFNADHVELPGSPCEDARRTLGWYCGYPLCCVDAFINAWLASYEEDVRYASMLDAVAEAQERGDEERAQAIADEWGAEQRAKLPSKHPVSGHVLCSACAEGPMAPLPPRPAERYGFLLPDRDYPDKPVRRFPPSGYGACTFDVEPTAESPREALTLESRAA